MCRSIKRLRNPGQSAATPEEVSAAARQFVRKISGYHHPSEANRESFDAAIAEISAASQRLLESIGSRGRNQDHSPGRDQSRNSGRNSGRSSDAGRAQSDAPPATDRERR